jgi:hypothetical protein
MELKEKKIKPFYFYTSYGNYTGENAQSLKEFLEKVENISLEKVENISIESLEFHLYGGDFERWFIDSLKAKNLATKLRKIREKKVKGEQLRTRVRVAVSAFLSTTKRKK